MPPAVWAFYGVVLNNKCYNWSVKVYIGRF